MKLYNNQLSPNGKRVRVTAAELGLALERQDLDFGKGEHKSPEYLAKNPNGKVPTLEDGTFTLWESPAIAWYLAAQNPGKGLLPTDARGQADTLRWMFWNASHFEKAVNTVVGERLLKPMFGQTPDPAKIDAGMKDVDRYAPILNAQLEGKQWLLGDAFTLADISLGVTAEIGAAGQIDWSRYPHIAAWLTRCTTRPAWKTA